MAVNLLCQSVPEGSRLNLELLRTRALQLLALLGQTGRPVSIVLLDDAAMAGYNQGYRHKQGPTNVLSFPSPADAGDELGDILISVETAAQEAGEKGVTLHQHLTWLIIHGLLHLLGHDHEASEAEAEIMRQQEEQLFLALQHPRRTNMPQLAVNVDHIATIREARGGLEPDPVLAAGICELAGARGIVVHLREDRRHIQDRDLLLLRQTVKTKLNLEMAAVKEMIDIAVEVRPDMVTLVPEKRQELTTEGGLDIIGNEKRIRKTVRKMTEAGIPVSLFIDPDPEQIKAAADAGAVYVELHTGRYCGAETLKEQDDELRLIEQAAEQAFEAGLTVNAGHGLDYRNVGRIAALSAIEELSIGHAVIARAVFVGLDQAVREMLDCMDRAA